eukprot:5143603-Amphidinium_carterae.1
MARLPQLAAAATMHAIGSKAKVAIQDNIVTRDLQVTPNIGLAKSLGQTSGMTLLIGKPQFA